MTAPSERPHRPARWLLAVTVLVVVALLSGLSGWSWTVPALALGVALAVALVARVVGVLLPREGRWIADRAGVLAGAGALVFLLFRSSGWAVLLALGILALVLAVPRRPARRLIGAAGVALALAGAAGLLVQGISDRAERAAADQAAGDITRGQLLPHTPADALVTLMRAVSRPNDAAGCMLLDDPAKVAFAAAYRAADCPAALRAAGAGVTDPNAYDRIERDSITIDQPGPDGPAVVDGCAVRWRPTLDQVLNGSSAAPAPTPGPPLGVLTVAPAYRTGWIITDVHPCSPPP